MARGFVASIGRPSFCKATLADRRHIRPKREAKSVLSWNVRKPISPIAEARSVCFSGIEDLQWFRRVSLTVARYDPCDWIQFTLLKLMKSQDGIIRLFGLLTSADRFHGDRFDAEMSCPIDDPKAGPVSLLKAGRHGARSVNSTSREVSVPAYRTWARR